MLDEPLATISGQVLAEFYAVTLKKNYLDAPSAAKWLETLSMMPMVDIGAPLVVEGAALSRRYRISYWDAALISACKRCDAAILYTEDLNHGQLYEDVRVVNPFLEN